MKLKLSHFFLELPRNFYNGATANQIDNVDGEDDDGLGPLPLKWEKAYTESGERYFIE